ncbi:hypothetical protein AQPE_4880 [Aquipluma nitroreducens]|uniref:Uncharacterized protein n=1 Tax=Aquipluma nitroreducens TaxID=2010828 RepID=A0A5K7SGQ8_9BACT|nr:hypothetical protein [Aquipluma nitroreducens]BBE20658.1 hypothetical protein AQPE_4852 [Aquipluma nitroreducens]BBE20686.1 hypothetical protein AQPE_4880 [Aquipluma nitroreducens]
MSEDLLQDHAYRNASEEEKEIGLKVEKLLIGLSVSSAQDLLKCVSYAIADKSKVLAI